MIISLIAAMAQNRVIGTNNKIPWNIPSDQKRFREITMGHTLLFGRVTYESIGHPLKGRKNIVLTRQSGYQAPGAFVVHSLDQAFAACRGDENLFICGGGIVFEETIALAHRIYLSVIHRDYEGDTFFPAIPVFFREASREAVNNTPPYSFLVYQRIR